MNKLCFSNSFTFSLSIMSFLLDQSCYNSQSAQEYPHCMLGSSKHVPCLRSPRLCPSPRGPKGQHT